MIKKNSYRLSLLAIISSASLVSACSTFEGATKDFTNWGNFLEEKFGNSAQEETTAQNFQTQSALVSNCPPVEQDASLSQLHEFENPSTPSEGSKIASAFISNLTSNCSMDDGFLGVTMDITFNASLGPKARARETDKPFFSFPYFVVVTDEAGTVLAKEVFAVSTSFEAGEQSVQTIETIRQSLPFEDNGTLPTYRMQVGFELSEEQLAYNQRF